MCLLLDAGAEPTANPAFAKWARELDKIGGRWNLARWRLAGEVLHRDRLPRPVRDALRPNERPLRDARGIWFRLRSEAAKETFPAEYQALVEDLADLAVIAERKGDPAESLEAVKQRLEEK